MNEQEICCSKERLFDALGAVFDLETKHAYETLKDATNQIAVFIADKGATSGSEAELQLAISKVFEMQAELAELLDQLEGFREVALSEIPPVNSRAL